MTLTHGAATTRGPLNPDWYRLASEAQTTLYNLYQAIAERHLRRWGPPMRAQLKGLMKVRKILADGTARHYCYAWRGGPLLKAADGSPLQPGDPTLVHAYVAAHEERRNPPTGDLAMLIRQFRLSSDFRTLNAASRREYERYLDEIRRQLGGLTLEEV